jgi:hypothetical protein
MEMTVIQDHYIIITLTTKQLGITALSNGNASSLTTPAQSKSAGVDSDI